jgi:hypothetical protein
VTTKSNRTRLLGYLTGLVCALTLGQSASALTLPQPPRPPEFKLACYYSFHLIDMPAYAPYAEIVFAGSTGLAGCGNLNTTLGVSNIVGIAAGTGPNSYAPISNDGPYTMTGLAAGLAAGLPELASVSVVNGVATLNSLTLYLQNSATYYWIGLSSEGQSMADLEFYTYNIQLTGGIMVPKSSWSSLMLWSSPIPTLTNPPSGEFPQ